MSHTFFFEGYKLQKEERIWEKINDMGELSVGDVKRMSQN